MEKQCEDVTVVWMMCHGCERFVDRMDRWEWGRVDRLEEDGPDHVMLTPMSLGKEVEQDATNLL